MVRWLLPLTQAKNSSTSSGLRMTSSFCGCLGTAKTSSKFHSRRSVTLYSKRKTETAMVMDRGDSFFSSVR